MPTPKVFLVHRGSARRAVQRRARQNDALEVSLLGWGIPIIGLINEGILGYPNRMGFA